MQHDPRADVDAVRRALSDPRDVCRRLGLDRGARPQGGGLMILCPAHQERTPSCSITRGPDGTLRAFAGAGIMADSVAETELAETELKLRPILEALGAGR